MKKAIYIFFGVLLILMAVLIYKFYWQEQRNLNALYLVPKDAVYILQTDDPVKHWEDIKKSDVWEHLNTNTYFQNITSGTHTLDTLINDNRTFLDMIGAKRVLVSAHVISRRDFDHLYIVNLGRTAKFTDFKTLLKKIISNHFELTERRYSDVDILELYDEKTRETLYLSVIDDNLVLSYTAQLVEAAIAQHLEPVIGRDLNFIAINKHTSHKGMLRFFVQYKYWDEFAGALGYNDDSGFIQSLSETLYFTGLDADLRKGKEIKATGYTNINDTDLSYLLSLQKAGTGTRSIEKIAPLRTAAYVSFGFSSYQKFYEAYLDLQAKDPDTYKSFMANQKDIEERLDIDLKKHIIDWIDDEVALLKFDTKAFGNGNDFALVIKTKNSKIATKQLGFITDQVRKKTPLKFKSVTYKDYTINYLSIKGFFKFFFGGFFKKFTHPYYSVIDDYVVFTNHPNTLKYIINNYLDKNTLSRSDSYSRFKKQFEKRSNVFVYVNTPLFYDSFVANFSGQTKQDLRDNEDYFSSFTHLGMQLLPQDKLFKNILAVKYEPWETMDVYKAKDDWNAKEEKHQEVEPVDFKAQDAVLVIPEINPNDLNAKVYKSTYLNGNIHIKVPLKDGKKHGRFKAYYQDGTLKMKGRFKNDLPVGTWRLYNEHGKLLTKKKF